MYVLMTLLGEKGRGGGRGGMASTWGVGWDQIKSKSKSKSKRQETN